MARHNKKRQTKQCGNTRQHKQATPDRATYHGSCVNLSTSCLSVADQPHNKTLQNRGHRFSRLPKGQRGYDRICVGGAAERRRNEQVPKHVVKLRQHVPFRICKTNIIWENSNRFSVSQSCNLELSEALQACKPSSVLGSKDKRCCSWKLNQNGCNTNLARVDTASPACCKVNLQCLTVQNHFKKALAFPIPSLLKVTKYHCCLLQE